MLSLCQTYREIVLSQMPPDLSEKEKRKRLFTIYYEKDFTKEEFGKILERLFRD